MGRAGIWKRLLLILAGFLVAWLAFAMFFDPDFVDDSDLALPDRKIDAAQNPYPEIRDLVFSEEELKIAYAIPFEHTLRLGHLPVEELLVRHRSELDRFERYAAMRDWKQDEPLGDQMDFSYVGACVALSNLKRYDAAKLASTGNMAAAIESAMSLHDFAAGFRSAGNPLGPSETAALLISRGGTFALLDLLIKHELADDDLIILASRLENPVLSRNNLPEALRAEYACVLATNSRSAFDREVRRRISSTGKSDIPRRLPTCLVYKPNLTREMYADLFRAAIRASDRDYREFSRVIGGTAATNLRKRWAHRLVGNALGYEVFTDLEQTQDYLENAFVTRVELALLRVRVAMERYRLQHGKWPPDLSALVPVYLSEVPVDPMDGKPIRYEVKRRVIYSVGKDFVDDGGEAPSEPGSLKSRWEIIIELEPAE